MKNISKDSGNTARASKYDRLIAQLEKDGTGTMKCFGNSMLPILSNPSVNEYGRQTSYRIGDIVFCKVKGRYIDAHLVTAKDGDRYQISNNHGLVNGWTRTVYGRVVRTTDKSGRTRGL